MVWEEAAVSVDAATIALGRLAHKKYFADFCKSRDSMRLAPKYFSVDTGKKC